MGTQKDFLLEKVASEIAGRESEILNNFFKAFIAQKSIEGFPVETLFDHFHLCVKHDFFKEMKSTYWFEPRMTTSVQK